MKIKKFGNTEKLVYELVKPIADSLGSSIWDVRFEKEGASWYLRVFIDRYDGVTIDDCEAVSRPLSDILDEKDPIPQGYFLEVGSAGLERELKRQQHFEAAVGEVLNVKLYRAMEGTKEVLGRLISFDKESLTLAFPFGDGSEDAKNVQIPLENISVVRLSDETSEQI